MSEEISKDKIRTGDKITASYNDGTTITGIAQVFHKQVVIGPQRHVLASAADKYERHPPAWHTAKVIKRTSPSGFVQHYVRSRDVWRAIYNDGLGTARDHLDGTIEVVVP